jgi:hypothetical protein
MNNIVGKISLSYIYRNDNSTYLTVIILNKRILTPVDDHYLLRLCQTSTRSVVFKFAVGFMVYSIALEQIFLQVLRFSPASITLPAPQKSYLIHYCRSYIILATGSVVQYIYLSLSFTNGDVSLVFTSLCQQLSITSSSCIYAPKNIVKELLGPCKH